MGKLNKVLMVLLLAVTVTQQTVSHFKSAPVLDGKTRSQSAENVARKSKVPSQRNIASE